MQKPEERQINHSDEELKKRHQYLMLSTLHQFSPSNPGTLKHQYLRELENLPTDYNIPRNRWVK